MLPLRYRLLLVIGGAAACALVPAPSAEQGRPAIAVAAVRQWLLSASAGAPLRRATHAGELPPLLVEFTNSPPLPEDARARAEQEIAAVAKEWAAARAARGEDVRFAPAAPAVPVRVMVAGRNRDRAAWIRTAAAARAVMFDRPLSLGVRQLDVEDGAATADLVDELQPKVLVQAA